MLRQERTGIEFPRATWVTFDRYDRYGAIARCLRASLGPGRHRVLDVGDAAGYLREFDDDVDLVGVDLHVQADRLEGAVALAADGARLPFPDRSFDAVVSSDVLEHVPAPLRAGFLAELSRVSRDLVVVAAPFDTDGVAGVEEVVRVYALLVTGIPQEQLEEHMERGLPDLAAARTAFEAHGPTVVVGNGNLWDWLELMLVKHQLMARPALQALHDGIDRFSNLALAGATDAPYYRHLVVARREQTPQLGEAPPPPLSPERARAMFASLLVAAGPESTRQDVVPALHALTANLADVPTRDELDTLRSSVEARFASIDAELAVVVRQGERVSSVLDRFLSPLRRARSLGRRRSDE